MTNKVIISHSFFSFFFQIVANSSDPDSPVWDTFATEGAKKDWADCCRAASDCCHRQLDQHQAAAEADEDDDGGSDNIPLLKLEGKQKIKNKKNLLQRLTRVHKAQSHNINQMHLQGWHFAGKKYILSDGWLNRFWLKQSSMIFSDGHVCFKLLLLHYNDHYYV